MRFLFVALVLFMAIICVVANEKCTRRCGYKYDPVCGKTPDGKFITFSSECIMESAACVTGQNITKAYTGECTEDN
ncbi:four-domain proteases inhibitor [Musca domestica]|uniref:Four-domain proteases inhibitor n=1 Tax=Musca domestica TaxID=7370 RepID=A0A1I8N1T7_MUSDO|nr:four-domain proteases inhibitor [Musca domestica]